VLKDKDTIQKFMKKFIKPSKQLQTKMSPKSAIDETTDLAKTVILLRSDLDKHQLSAEREKKKESFTRSIERQMTVTLSRISQESPVVKKNLNESDFTSFTF